jgi:hypothetical protein
MTFTILYNESTIYTHYPIKNSTLFCQQFNIIQTFDYFEY